MAWKRRLFLKNYVQNVPFFRRISSKCKGFVTLRRKFFSVAHRKLAQSQISHFLLDCLILWLIGFMPVLSKCACSLFSCPAVYLVFRIPFAEVYAGFESTGFLATFLWTVSLIFMFFLVWFFTELAVVGSHILKVDNNVAELHRPGSVSLFVVYKQIGFSCWNIMFLTNFYDLSSTGLHFILFFMRLFTPFLLGTGGVGVIKGGIVVYHWLFIWLLNYNHNFFFDDTSLFVIILKGFCPAP